MIKIMLPPPHTLRTEVKQEGTMVRGTAGLGEGLGAGQGAGSPQGTAQSRNSGPGPLQCCRGAELDPARTTDGAALAH